MTYILGIDTSAYTTSIALIDAQSNKILADERKVLEVGKGQKGLRQQEAVFQHLKNLPVLYGKITQDITKVKTICVSSKPRNSEDSYMPVFTVGQNFGKVISRTLDCSYIEYSHQENHISASLIDNYKNIDHRFLAVHISGGTTEFVSAEKGIKGFETKIVGGTKDITFGQLIEYLAGKRVDEIKTPAVSGSSYINLSGMENYYGNLVNKYTRETVINSLFKYIAECILHIIRSLSHFNFKTVIISGGVASNSRIRNYLIDNIKEYEIIFPSVENSSDNAVGLAFLPIIDRWYNEIKTD